NKKNKQKIKKLKFCCFLCKSSLCSFYSCSFVPYVTNASNRCATTRCPQRCGKVAGNVVGNVVDNVAGNVGSKIDYRTCKSMRGKRRSKHCRQRYSQR